MEIISVFRNSEKPSLQESDQIWKAFFGRVAGNVITRYRMFVEE